jgi:hypothetical protein
VDKVEEAEEVLQWHAANLEFALGAPLDRVSAEWWNFDDVCAYAGPHWVLPGACYFYFIYFYFSFSRNRQRVMLPGAFWM